jgi:hypothetical protein
MKIAFMGPGSSDASSLGDVVRRLAATGEYEKIVYLGDDDSIDQIVDAWRAELGAASLEGTLTEATRLASHGSAGDIHAFLDRHGQASALSNIVRVPAAPARTIELLDDRILTIVFDKATLNEDDIANSTVLIYGKSPEPFVRQIGPRYFLTPGPISRGVIGVAEVDATGQAFLGLYSLDGTTVWRDAVQSARASRIRVSR